MSTQPRILATKKLSASQKEHVLTGNCTLVEADFIEVTFNTLNDVSLSTNIIITSKNGVKSLLKNNLANAATVKVFCVGIKTKQLLEAEGFLVVHQAATGEELAQYIIQNYSDENFTYICGNIRRHELPDALRKNNINLEEVVAYKTMITPKKIAGVFDGILFFSPSQVESFALANSIGNSTAFCIGTTTANTAKQYTQNIVIANKPTIENTIIQAIKYYKS